MPKHDVIVIGDSLAAIHCALELTRDDFSILLIRPDVFPIDVYETSQGAFDCDLASGCDFSYYSSKDSNGGLIGVDDRFEMHPFPFRLRGPSLSLDEPATDYDFQVRLIKQYPSHRSELMIFLCRSRFIHELADEIESKTGVGTNFRTLRNSKLISQLNPWNYNAAKSLIAQSFKDFFTLFNLPGEFLKLYEIMCNDHFGLGLDSIDALSGVELITRRNHGLTRFEGGWVVFKDLMLEKLRNSPNVKIIGGKKIDVLKSSAGSVYEIYVDERGTHQADWFVIDESLGFFEKKKSGNISRYFPIGCHSRSHVDFRLFIGWESKPKREIPVGVNYFYHDAKFPPHAPHLLRFDVMPVENVDENNLRSKITIRGRYPWERIKTSWDYNAEPEVLKDEILDKSKQFIDFHDDDPSYMNLVLPYSYYSPHCRRDEYERMTSSRTFKKENRNVRVIRSTSLNGGSMRLAFKDADRIAENLIRNIRMRNRLRNFISTPITRLESFKRIATGRTEDFD